MRLYDTILKFWCIEKLL